VVIPSDGQDHEVLSLSLPAGNYAFTAKANLDGTGHTTCDLNLDGAQLDLISLGTDSGNPATVALAGVGSVAVNGTASVGCYTTEDDHFARQIKIVAIRVGAIH
jgi:hypothetical protein